MARHGGPGPLARLQQVLTLGALGLAGVWAIYWTSQGRPWLAAAGVGLILGGYAAVLAFEMVLLYFTHGADPSPRARVPALWRAWWGEVKSAPTVFCWRQPFRSQVWPDQLPARAPGRRGVLFIHGFVCNRGVWNPWLARLTAQGTPFVAVNLVPVFGTIDDTIGVVEDAVRRLEAATGQAPVVVAHSMGGLVLRRWWAEHGAAVRVHHVITIGTPHQGTWLARWGHTANARQMQIDSPWLLNLAQREGPSGALKLPLSLPVSLPLTLPLTSPPISPLTSRMTCFYSDCDNIVFPPSRATLPGANNIHLPGLAHVHMADAPEPWAELQRRLAD